MTVKALSAAILDLGECPVWWKDCLYRTDILNCRLHRFNPVTGIEDVREFPAMIGAFAPRLSGGFVAATDRGFAFLDFDTGAFQVAAHPEADKRTNRFNDGKCDPGGVFWAGTMNRNGEGRQGCVYTFDTTGRVGLRIERVAISNGIEWSHDGRTFYHNDSPTHEVAAYDLDPASRTVRNRRVVRKFHEAEGVPDGMTMDTGGRLWIAMWGGGAVVCLDPKSGELLHRVEVPVSQPSSCTFGGGDLGDLYITSARVDLSAEQLAREPLAGALFVARPGAIGNAVSVYTDGMRGGTAR